MTDSSGEADEMYETICRLGRVLGRLPGDFTAVDSVPRFNYGTDLPTEGESMPHLESSERRATDRVVRIERRLQIIHEWHIRSVKEAAAAKASLDMRDWEMFEGGVQDRLTIAELSATTGLSHAALYKAIRRGSTFREPPLPF